jgi:TonB family protein
MEYSEIQFSSLKSLCMPEKKNTIGRFEILEKIGEGPIGAVYKALDPVIRRTVAIKVVKLYALEETTTFADVFEKIYRVVRTSTSLNHPNICVIYDLSEEKKIPYITMEYIDGQDLDTALQKKRKFKRSEIVGILQQAGDAIDFAHKKNVIHQDLKSTNILLTSDLHVKITDFGIAGLDEIAAAQTKKLLSIPFYISPEQALGEKVSPASDLFSLAVIAHQLLSGELPFPGTSAAGVVMMIARDPQSAPKNLSNSGISKEQWAQFFNKALSKAPERRFNSAKEMLDALFAIVPESTTTTYPFSAKEAPAASISDSASSAPTLLLEASKILDDTAKQTPTPSPFANQTDATIISRKVAQGDGSVSTSAQAPVAQPEPEDDVSETISVSKEKIEEERDKLRTQQPIESETVQEFAKTELIKAPIIPPAKSEEVVASPPSSEPPQSSAAQTTIIPPPPSSSDKTIITPPVPPTPTTMPPEQAAQVGRKTGVGKIDIPQGSVPIKPPVGPGSQPSSPAKPNMQKYFIGAILVAVFIALVGGLIFLFKGKPEPKTVEQPTPTPPTVQQKPAKPKPQTVEFVASSGQISITSEPVGATVFLGEEEKGLTPLVLADLPYGKYILKLQLKGYQDQQQEIDLTADSSSLNVPVTLEKAAPQVGILVVESSPAGAAIIMNKKVVGVTPKTFTNMKASKYTIGLKLDGHEDYTGSVRVKPNETTSLQAKMVEIYKPPPPEEPKPVKVVEPTVTPGMLVQLGQPGVVPPKSIKKIAAKYPDAAKQRRLEGVVVLSILVSETGKVIEVKVVKSANAILDEAAVQAVQQWSYQPATKNGVPVKVWVPVSMSFQRSR